MFSKRILYFNLFFESRSETRGSPIEDLGVYGKRLVEAQGLAIGKIVQ